MAVNPNDALRLVNCPKETSDALSAAVEGKWTRRSWLASGGMECLELKLKAAPGNERSKGRSLMLEILEESARNGLSVLTSLAMSISSSDRMLLVMRSSSAASIFHLFVGLSGSNKIRLSGGDEEFRNSMKKVIEDNWISGLLPYLKLRRDECKLALKGTPWGSRFAHPHSSRSMMTKVLAKLQNEGFTVLCSADLPSKWISYGASASTNVHTWIVAKSGYDSCAMESEMGNI
ncbi:hypothetical protein L596_027987 [Steinernema carpocapsae]|uniref:Uncharacterized protein n=1 Tax=Steinernema carpocapsae TaxID=34508 RepID=A0A4U5LX86_STECR|nr:hypothetical protein L596_027987 [Steinernema carpocapsae]